MTSRLSLLSRLVSLTENWCEHQCRKLTLLRTYTHYNSSVETTITYRENDKPGICGLPVTSKPKEFKTFLSTFNILSSFKGLVKCHKQLYQETSFQKRQSFHSVVPSKLNSSINESLSEKPTQIHRIDHSDRLQIQTGVRPYSKSAIFECQKPIPNHSVKQTNKKKMEQKLVTAYATADEYEMEALKMALETQGLYVLSDLPEDVTDVLHAQAKYTVDEEIRELFFFREGGVVLWNMPDVERNEVLKFLKRYSHGDYKSEVVVQEQEQLQVVSSTQASTNLIGNTVYLKEDKDGEGDNVLEKYAFSNSLSQSVKLGIWEASLQKFVSSIEPITEDLKSGRHVNITRREALQKIGELFALRHQINLSSDLLDTPDFYWEHDDLERLYSKTSRQLMISRRTKVVNEKLNYCIELMELLNSHMNDAHHVRLEWMIILLIMVEVAFEVLRHIEKYMLLDKLTRPMVTPKNVTPTD